MAQRPLSGSSAVWCAIFQQLYDVQVDPTMPPFKEIGDHSSVIGAEVVNDHFSMVVHWFCVAVRLCRDSSKPLGKHAVTEKHGAPSSLTLKKEN